MSVLPLDRSEPPNGWVIGDNRGIKPAQGAPGYPESRGDTAGYTMGSYPEQCNDSRSSVETCSTAEGLFLYKSCGDLLYC